MAKCVSVNFWVSAGTKRRALKSTQSMVQECAGRQGVVGDCGAIFMAD
ncbi:MAG: hypothetical protein IKO14_10620 [Oscillibacter sp.]|nr:hypothetical protein [Oscillibacter sp.]